MLRRISPLRYPGGKASLAPKIISIVNQNHLNHCTYIEPFAGGAGVALAMLFSETVPQIWINDADIHIYAFWHSILHNSKEFVQAIEQVPVTIEEWERQKEIYECPSGRFLFDIGFSTFFLNRTNHSGILNARPIGGLNQTGEYGISARFNKRDLISRIRRIACFKDKIRVSNLDALELLKTNNSKENFIYLDPPYYVKGGSLYLSHYQRPDHELLSDFLKNEAVFPWVVSYDNHQVISEIYSELRQFEFSLNYQANQHKKGKELLIFSNSLNLEKIVPVLQI